MDPEINRGTCKLVWTLQLFKKKSCFLENKNKNNNQLLKKFIFFKKILFLQKNKNNNQLLKKTFFNKKTFKKKQFLKKNQI